MRVLLYNANIILRNEILYGYVLTDHGTILAVESGVPADGIEADEKINVDGQYLSPGFVELHTHGAGGADFMDGTVSAFLTAARTHMEHGTTSLLPTSLTASPEDTKKCVENFISAKSKLKNGPNLLGLHMEGPYLNPIYKGAMNESYLRLPNPNEYISLIENYKGAILRWTTAPELPGALELGDYLTSHGICASIGHSAADYQTVQEAFRHGYTHVTHLYSAMSSITRRDGFRYPGVLESALILDGMTVEIIADGCHLPPELLSMTYRTKGADYTSLTCDSMRCAGTDAKESVLGCLTDGLPVLIEDGVAKLMDRSGFGGSIATDDRLIRTMYKDADVPLIDCVRMMCETPARIIGIDKQKGAIACGKDADLVIFDDDINIKRVMIQGNTTYQYK